jgi:phage gp36-like protein
MPYSSKQDLIDSVGKQDLIEYTDEEGTQTIDDRKLAKAGETADTMIDSALRGRYTVPLVPIPPTTEIPADIKELSIDLTIYILAKNHYRKELPPAIRDRYANASAYLAKLADGRIKLEQVTPAPTAATESPIRANKRTRVFTDDLLGRFT